MNQIREIAKVLYPDGDYQVVQIKTFAGTEYKIVRAFFLTEARANEWSKYWPNSIVEKM